MKKLMVLLPFSILLFCQPLTAQILGEGAVKEILVKTFNQKLPKILGNGELLNGLDLADLRIRPGFIRVKGKTKWNLKLGKSDKPIKFKGNISTRFKSFGKSDLKVNLPGDRFLFFPKYQKLNDLINFEQLKQKKEKA